MTGLFNIILVIIAAFIGAFGSLYLKFGSEKASRSNLLALFKNYKLIFGVFLYGISSVIFLFALKNGELSVLYPFAATAYVWTCLFSVKYLNEKMTKLKWFGIIMILIGVSLIGIGS